MKATLTTVAVIGALAIGGVPALALTLTGTESAPPGSATLVHAASGVLADDPAADEADETDDEGTDAGTPGWMRHEQRVPPGWAKNHKGGTPFGWQMRSWAKCVADHSAPDAKAGDRTAPPAACGAKPRPPHGHGRPPGHAKAHKGPEKAKPQQG